MDISWKLIRRPFICAQDWVSTSIRDLATPFENFARKWGFFNFCHTLITLVSNCRYWIPVSKICLYYEIRWKLVDRLALNPIKNKLWNYIKAQAGVDCAPACFSGTTGPIILKFGLCITHNLSWPYATSHTDMSGIFRTFHRKAFPECISQNVWNKSSWNFAEFLFGPL